MKGLKEGKERKKKEEDEGERDERKRQCQLNEKGCKKKRNVGKGSPRSVRGRQYTHRKRGGGEEERDNQKSRMQQDGGIKFPAYGWMQVM